ncbi:MAG: ABC-type enterochelin transport system ATPase subunit [Porticoccaceae bacterium]|jgi:ABC-type enterochelin transport system ATPase subunit
MKLGYIYIYLLAILFLTQSCSKKGDGIKPKIGSVSESVYASEVIKADDQYIVFSTVRGILQKISVVSGQSISRGQSLFYIFKKLTEDFSQTILAVTHDTYFANNTDRTITMEDGRILV